MLAPLLAIQALSGAVLLWMQPLPSLQESPPAVQAWARAVDLGLAELARRYPTAKIEYVNLPAKTDAPVSVRLLASGSNESGWADIDAVNGTVGALQPDSSQARTLLYALHEHWLLADARPWVLRAMALTALVLVAMGLRVWWRVRHMPARTPLRRLHRLIGPVVVLPLAMMLVTGFVLRSPEWTRSALSAWAGSGTGRSQARCTRCQRAAGGDAGPGRTAAAAALPQSRPIPHDPARDGVVRVRMRGDERQPPRSGQCLRPVQPAPSMQRIVRAAEQPLSVRYLNVVYPLHLGSLPGKPGSVAAPWRAGCGR